ncbi:Metallo-dependent phosphatase-like protein [Amylostereum chailletii]|nr:Metallo-dependent phosphatase-like protein [Amylostereum chailletii]
MKTALFSLLAGAALVAGCAEHEEQAGEAHVHSKRAAPSRPLTPPARALEWGDVNIIHTTDSHGWLLGHQKPSLPEPNYSGDFGDFASFVAHMKEIAWKKGVDLLLVDSGDLHDGTGLSDGYPAGGVDAHDSNEFFAKLPYDVLAIGNHELYVYNNTLDVHKNFAPKWKGRYLSSNVNITLPDKHGKLVSVPVGERFAKFRTLMGRKVTSLGVLFDFTGNDKNTTVQKVEDMVKEAWFAEAIKEEPDLFLLAGHMPVVKDNWPAVFNAVRAVHPTTPILIFGGHTHIRDCTQLDGRSMSLESGRYMETVGWMSVKLDKKHNSAGNLTFSRRYLDPNRVTYEYHTGRSNFTFDTWPGKLITQGLNQLAKRFDLSSLFGTAPQDYTISRNAYPSNGSLLSLVAEQALPVSLAVNNARATIPNLIITNSGGLRFDVFKGAFTKNDQLTASPFADAFYYVTDVPLGVATQVLATLNSDGSNQRRELLEARERELYARGEVGTRYRRWLEEMATRETVERRAAGNLTVGYVTSDSCPGVGDDTLHTAMPFFSAPDFIASTPPAVPDATAIDLVFVNFIESQLLATLNALQADRTYTSADVGTYSSVMLNTALGVFAQEAWN